MPMNKTKINEKRLNDNKVHLEHIVSDSVGGIETLDALKRLMIQDAISDCAYWTEVVTTLQEDITSQGVTVNRIGVRKDAKPRSIVENPLVSILYKMQPRKTDAMKRLYKLVSGVESIETDTDKSALFEFNTYESK